MNLIMYHFEMLTGMPGYLASSVWKLEWLGLAGAGLGVVHFGRKLSRVLGAQWWRSTQGRILDVNLRKSRGRESDGSIIYEPLIRYAYRVGDREMEGRRISNEASTGALTWGLKMIRNFRPGAEVAVFYHPQRPSEAVLQRAGWQVEAAGFVSCLLLLTLLLTQVFG